jgi:membrane protein
MDYFRKRLFSFGLIVSIAFLLLISLVFSSVFSALSAWMENHWSVHVVVLMTILNYLVSLLSGTMLFAIMFKILPDAKIQWKTVWPGALFTAFLFEGGKFALSFYFGHANPGSGYGAAGSIILIMLWTSFTSMIVLFGAVLTRTISDQW